MYCTLLISQLVRIANKHSRKVEKRKDRKINKCKHFCNLTYIGGFLHQRIRNLQ